jgi:hypothetical protein
MNVAGAYRGRSLPSPLHLAAANPKTSAPTTALALALLTVRCPDGGWMGMLEEVV